MQIIVGSSVLAVPIAFTEETWNLGISLPTSNVVALWGMSVVFIAAYVYFNFYRELFRQFTFDYLGRVILIYLLSLAEVGVLLTIIQKAPWAMDF
jgi:uncharacterized membrane protein